MVSRTPYGVASCARLPVQLAHYLHIATELAGLRSASVDPAIDRVAGSYSPIEVRCKLPQWSPSKPTKLARSWPNQTAS